ncbi:hypothetical protein TIFTF001_006343 [Ficus carica]|uniref:Uncharacterized protein n=1 Tax=Ficus carica TaxID=3494 RepID=A0AA88CVX4_FICCA|nr:hypothetical protein TIFTF001_006343 [Ficus carica]
MEVESGFWTRVGVGFRNYIGFQDKARGISELGLCFRTGVEVEVEFRDGGRDWDSGQGLGLGYGVGVGFQNGGQGRV